MEEKEQKELELLAAKVRRDVVEMLLHRGYGHLGGSLSMTAAPTCPATPTAPRPRAST